MSRVARSASLPLPKRAASRLSRRSSPQSDGSFIVVTLQFQISLAECLPGPGQQRLDGLGRFLPIGCDLGDAPLIHVLRLQNALVALRQGGEGPGDVLR